VKKGLLIISIAYAKIVVGQQPQTSVWSALQVPVSFGIKWQWHNDAGYRTIGFTSSPYQYLYRTGARYFFNKEWSVAGGIAFFFTRNSYQKADHEFGKEFRLWQELNFNKAIGKKFSLQNRIRTEERWFDAVGNKDAYYAFRLRCRLAGTEKLSDRWSIQLADEYMQQSVSNDFTFNQNRLMTSAIYNLDASSQLQWGYMWLFRPVLSQHVLTISFQKNISVHGSKQHKE
jgi:Protein of unknown function (DUF2490)